MKFLRTLFAGCLLLLLNSAVVANAQEDKNESIKPAQQDEAKPGTANPQEPMPKQEEKREERNTQGKDRQPAREPNAQQNDESDPRAEREKHHCAAIGKTPELLAEAWRLLWALRRERARALSGCRG